MQEKRVAIKYIEGKNPDQDDIAGIIISVFSKNILIGVTEKHGGDAEISLNIETAKELIKFIESAVELITEKQDLF